MLRQLGGRAPIRRGVSKVVEIANIHAKAIQDAWRQWWHIRRARIYPRTEHRQPFAKARGVGLCFSGGIDSFYSLRRSRAQEQGLRARAGKLMRHLWR